MSKARVRLLRPLNGRPEHSVLNYSKADAERLEGYGALEILGEAVDDVEEEGDGGIPANQSDPLDHDNDGRKGGSLKGSRKGRRKAK